MSILGRILRNKHVNLHLQKILLAANTKAYAYTWVLASVWQYSTTNNSNRGRSDILRPVISKGPLVYQVGVRAGEGSVA